MKEGKIYKVTLGKLKSEEFEVIGTFIKEIGYPNICVIDRGDLPDYLRGYVAPLCNLTPMACGHRSEEGFLWIRTEPGADLLYMMPPEGENTVDIAALALEDFEWTQNDKHMKSTDPDDGTSWETTLVEYVRGLGAKSS